MNTFRNIPEYIPGHFVATSEEFAGVSDNIYINLYTDIPNTIRSKRWRKKPPIFSLIWRGKKPVGMRVTGAAAAVRSRAGAHDPGAGASAIPRPVLVPVAKKKKKRSEADLLR